MDTPAAAFVQWSSGAVAGDMVSIEARESGPGVRFLGVGADPCPVRVSILYTVYVYIHTFIYSHNLSLNLPYMITISTGLYLFMSAGSKKMLGRPPLPEEWVGLRGWV